MWDEAPGLVPGGPLLRMKFRRSLCLGAGSGLSLGPFGDLTAALERIPMWLPGLLAGPTSLAIRLLQIRPSGVRSSGHICGLAARPVALAP